MSYEYKKIYVECGTTARSAVNTGIQRVVRNITNELLTIDREYNFGAVLVEFKGEGFYPISREEVKAESVKRSILWRMLKRIDNILSKLLNASLLGKARTVIKRFLFRKEDQKSVRKINLEQGAILLLLDSTWDMSLWRQVDKFKAQGGYVCAVLYDLIPFTHPDTVEENTRIAHTKWWLEAQKHLDGVICISQAVRKEYLDWQKNLKLMPQLAASKVGYFHLGSEIAKRDPVVKILKSNLPFFIMVGSLEPRKNHSTVIDAFEILWANNIAAQLVIIGAYGWKTEALIERIHKHAQYGAQLYLIRDASDRDLAALYKNAASLISASYAEGFGLPIVEAQQHGMPVICSDIPVFREVAGVKNVKFFNPLEVISLMRVLKSVCDDISYEASSIPMVAGLSWSDSTRQLCHGIQNITNLRN